MIFRSHLNMNRYKFKKTIENLKLFQQASISNK